MMTEDEEHFVPDYDEDMHEDDEITVQIPKTLSSLPSPSKRGIMTKGGRSCILCFNKFSHVRRHMSLGHLQWYFDPYKTCWQCKKIEPQNTFLNRHLLTCKNGRFTDKYVSKWRALMNGLFCILSQMLGYCSVDELVSWVKGQKLFFSTVTFSAYDNTIMKLYDKDSNPSVACLSASHLTHWHIFTKLMATRNSQQQNQIRMVEKLRFMSVLGSDCGGTAK